MPKKTVLTVVRTNDTLRNLISLLDLAKWVVSMIKYDLLSGCPLPWRSGRMGKPLPIATGNWGHLHLKVNSKPARCL